MPHELPPNPSNGAPKASEERRGVVAGTIATSIAMGGAITAMGWLIFAGALIVAAGIHLIFGVSTSNIKPIKRPERVEMAIVKTEPPPPPPPPPPPEEPPPPPPEPEKPKPKPKVKPPEPKTPVKEPPPPEAPPPPSNDTPPEPTNEPPVIATGVTMSSTVSNSNSGMKVRVGNTTYGDPNKEKFVAADKVKAYSGGKPGWKPVRAASVTKQARVGRKWRAKYPRELVEEGIEGAVVLKVKITAAGKVYDVKVVKGLHPRLDKLAIESVRKSIWVAGEQDGVKIDSEISYTIRFEITD